jgi:hypothetical protein
MTEDATQASLREQTPEPARIYQLPAGHLGFQGWKPVLLSFISTRLGLAALTLTVAIVSNQPVLHLWNHWDGNWYVGIANSGYHWSIRGKPAVAFFPLYPLLIHLGVWLHVRGVIAALAISNAAFLGASYYLYRLVAEERGEKAAGRAVWLLALFPTAFFTFGPYSESIFLLCGIAALYYARRGRLVPAALWLGADVLTRPTGALLIPAVLVALYFHRRETLVHAEPDYPVERGDLKLVASDRGREGLWAPITPSLVARMAGALLPAVVGIAAYLYYLHLERIPASLVFMAQRSWHRSPTFPWVGFTSSATWLFHHGAHNFPWTFEAVVEGSVTTLCLALTAFALRHMRWDARLYCIGFWALVLATPEWRDGYHAPFSSVDRFVLTLFPVFAWAAEQTPNGLYRRIAIVSAAAMAAITCAYLAGGWIG